MVFRYCAWQDLLEIAAARNQKPFLLALDGLEDPRNFGAILRTAEAAGAHGVIIPKRRSVQLNDTVMRTSTGAAELVPVAQAANINEVLQRLKKEGLWIAGLEADGGTDYRAADYTDGLTLVLGGEGRGLSRLTRTYCDFVVRIPLRGQITSLNASVAAALLLYEVVRQRDAAGLSR
ncbi:MAG: 23S rRNA (guanosine(2251)-2'-O)-methyltransferase RlmB [Candidatus Margulisbacteria bacterium]|jgi:23S rRNA (guanosine2251-2'-O)-methyltransferase|nr:23S rRNA (guanosine(2251)-2'-O)-methyltransferase RlmB [Candidatus Margulisiibacteriota bacterium]